MHEFMEILNAGAQVSVDGVTPDFELRHNGTVLVIKAKTRRDFDTADQALTEARLLLRELLDVPGWVPVSEAAFGASADAFDSRRSSESSGWRGSLRLVLCAQGQVDAREAEGQPYLAVTGFPDTP